MTILLSISGLFKTLLIIIGVFVALRFIGQLMIAKRNISEQNALQEKRDKFNQQKKFVEKNMGKISISKKQSAKAEDVDYEEI
jgi:sensor domain CHASE-containing protein